jgi:hypothetical protein
MTAGELLAIVRASYLDDVADTADADEAALVYRWSDETLLREIAMAQRQACYRQDLRHLFDDTTAELCSITLAEGVASYPLDARILRLHEVLYGGEVLPHLTQAVLDQVYSGWRSWAAGAPRGFYVIGRTLRVVPTPSASEDGETLALAVWREPLCDPDSEDDLEWTLDPERLAHWVAYRAFSVPDLDSVQASQAANHLALFERAFGPEVPAQARAELLAFPPELSFTPATGYARPRAARVDFDRSA